MRILRLIVNWTAIFAASLWIPFVVAYQLITKGKPTDPVFTGKKWIWE